MLLSLAIRLARSNPGTDRAKMAAVIAKRNTVLAVGFNQYKSHPLQAQFSANEEAIFLHAEIDAIRNCIREHGEGVLSGSTLYIARVYKNGKPALAKPCKGCQRAIAAFNIKHVVWTKGEN